MMMLVLNESKKIYYQKMKQKGGETRHPLQRPDSPESDQDSKSIKKCNIVTAGILLQHRGALRAGRTAAASQLKTAA
jgi:hypothetical protein